MPSIELDCPPGLIRPCDLLPQIIEGTGLDVDDFVIASKVFGNWEFVLNADKENVYKNAIDTIKKRITDLYNSGRFRYGSW